VVAAGNLRRLSGFTAGFWAVVSVVYVLYLKVSLMDPGYWPVGQQVTKPEGTFVVLVEEPHPADQENVVTVKDENLPSDNVHDQSGSSLVNISRSSRIDDKLRRFCTACRLDQPLRTKHCRDCKKCVSLYDHHCPWIGGCVGQNNRLYFFWFVFFQCLELWLALFAVLAM
jgi:hypothetical protein